MPAGSDDDTAPAGGGAPREPREPLERDPWAPPPEDAVPPVRPGPWASPPGTGPSGVVHPLAAPGEPVPPPPLSPDGPGRMPYGYEGYAGQLGHPGYVNYQGHPGYPGHPGHPAQGMPGYGWPAMPMAPANGMGVAGLILGVIATVGFCLWPLAIVLGILAVIFGAVGRAKARRGEATNGGQALAGIICGAAGIVLGVALLVVLIAMPDDETDAGAALPECATTQPDCYSVRNAVAVRALAAQPAGRSAPAVAMSRPPSASASSSTPS